ncbi:UDP-N-acetylmuramoyl-tripeptide--D-alanyl-D-alanine ligase [Bacillus coahuilensis m2-6]|uniref:UDP-N-acetylmuramoyl-tripeptide--D-alanyl-D- alanine ligase n=1 Tax=Bacillus coahuilensis TaxID=408580 RepID=UPI00018506C9|nr:UDP-N-acetylmuramoyl-tripeptide--D-alanyl-D-alanine ligase [Bacillus coahuilensis]KUP04522.1 UDP-N-acetylmuramoyl-tripeptide--D-alanyl-D-alanine ligase [Bacillus coahuilensis m2-6]
MIKRTIGQIATIVGALNDVSLFKDQLVHGVIIDTRKLTAGNLFVPFKGENVDGHTFVRDVLEKGAGAAFWEKSAGPAPEGLPVIVVEDSLVALQTLSKAYRNELNVKVVGVTGSNGKTTTKDILFALLSTKYRVHKTEGNYNNHIGLPLTILSLPEDSEVAVLEMGMSGFGEIRELTQIALPDAAIITNIGESHLQDLGSREGISKAKFEIVEGLKSEGLFVYNGDEPLLQERVKGYGGSKETFGRHSSNTMYPTKLAPSGFGTTFSVNVSDEEFHLPILGEHNVMNTMGAMLIAKFFGVGFGDMQKGLSTLKLTGMRLEVSTGAKGETIINDAYNASPSSTKAAIDLLQTISTTGKRYFVVSDMLELGPNEEAFHHEVGTYVTDDIDCVLTYGPLSSFIAEGAKETLPEDRVIHFDEKSALIAYLKVVVKSDDTVLVKASRGMKMEEVVLALQKE